MMWFLARMTTLRVQQSRSSKHANESAEAKHFTGPKLGGCLCFMADIVVPWSDHKRAMSETLQEALLLGKKNMVAMVACGHLPTLS